MADAVTFQGIKGLPELRKAFALLDDDMQKRAGRAATMSAAVPIKRRAVQKIKSSPSVETGALSRSVIIKRLPKSQTPPATSEHIVTVRGRGKTSTKTGRTQDSAPHAHFVEFGTVHMPAEPFLRPALFEGKEEAVQKMGDSLERSIKAAAARVPTPP